MKRLFLLLLLIAVFGRAASAVEEPKAVLPSDTDARITRFNEPHLVWHPQGSPRNQLLLFLPGTGGTPEKGSAHAFAALAAQLGYHVISLMYPDNIASQVYCSRSADPDAYLTFRNAIIAGGPMGKGRSVAPQDAIENRLEKLLVYLKTRDPDAGWGQFIRAEGGVRWESVAVAGQSQGGGHAYMLGKNYEVARVILFSSPKDYSFYFNAPPKGFDGNVKTPLTRFFAYNHMRDNGNGCTHEQQVRTLEQIGLPRLGVTTVDRDRPPFHQARVLYTDVDVSGDHFHGSVLNGRFPANHLVWRYLLTEPAE